MPTATNSLEASPDKKALLKALAIELGVVQREAKELGIPVIVTIEALDASRKGRLLNQILLEIDSRAYQVYSTHAQEMPPREYPLLWRFWNHTPPKGNIQFYDRGPYYLVLDTWAEGKLKEDEMQRYWRDIRNFENMLNDDGVVQVKIFLTVSRKVQQSRLKELESNPKTAWRVTAKDWKRHRQHKECLAQAKAMIDETDAPFAPWHMIDTDSYKPALIRIYQVIIDRLKTAVQERRERLGQPGPSKKWIHYKGTDHLAAVDLSAKLARGHYKRLLKERQKEIYDLVHEIHSKRIPVALVYCGWDAAGKGGCIKRFVQGMDPSGYTVIPVGAPTSTELSHHYLWRFWRDMPARGKVTIFDRSWYGRVLVERVEGLCSNDEWQRAYREINQMEQHLTDYGMVIIKFWLQIDSDTQLERFIAREENPIKRWKITEEDWRNREKWERYEESVNEMFEKTNTDYSPWNIVSSNCKMHARIKTLDIIISRFKKALKKPVDPAL